MDKTAMAKDLKRQLDKACDAYYNSGNLIMTDEEFDNACQTYKKLTGETYKTQTAARKGKRVVNVSHGFENLVGTIDNKVANIKGVQDWLEYVYKNLGLKKSTVIEVMASKKYDGNSVAIEFDGGNCKVALTRGEDGEGADLTDVFKDEIVGTDIHIGVRYECMMSYENFDSINLIRESNKEKLFANPRSTVAGVLGSNDAYKYREFLTLVPLSLQAKDKKLTRYEELELIDEYVKKGDIEYDAEIYEGTLDSLVAQIEGLYTNMIPERENMGYMIDGIVIELMDNDLKDKLGFFDKGSPKWACALKFPYMEKGTEVLDIVFEASPNGSGKITPSAIYAPVYFNGARQSKTSLASYKRFKDLKLGKGSKIIVQYRNDVLSYVNKLDTPENDKIKPVPFTEECPCCHSRKLRIATNDKDEETNVYCDNPYCEMKVIGRVNNYTTCVGIKGIEVATVQKIFDAGLIKSSADLYRLRYRDLAKVPGLGDSSAMNIIDAIKKRTPNDYEIIAGLGIANVGETLAKVILGEMPLDMLADVNYVASKEFKSRIRNLEGFSDIMTNRLSEGLVDNNMLLNDLLANVIVNTTRREKAENQLIFVATGDPDKKYFKDRDEMKSYIESKGHKMTGSVSGKTNYLVTENTDSGTVKNQKAKDLGVQIITSAGLKDLLG